MPALSDPVHHPGCVVTRGVASRLAQLQPRGVWTGAGRPQVGGARGNDTTVDGHLQLLARRVEARHEEGNVEIEALAQPPADLAGLTVGVDDEPRQVRGQEVEVVEAGGALLRKRVLAQAQVPVQSAASFRNEAGGEAIP